MEYRVDSKQSLLTESGMQLAVIGDALVQLNQIELDQ